MALDSFLLKYKDLKNRLSEEDRRTLHDVEALYSSALSSMQELKQNPDAREKLIETFGSIGDFLQNFVSKEERVHVYSFETPRDMHGEASYLISKLRSHNTNNEEFVYFTQRAYELLFNFTFLGSQNSKKNYFIIPTPVSEPVGNLAVHKIPNVDDDIQDTAVCVMLRGALLPSMIMSKAIQEYSSTGYVTPFSLFKIRRNESESEEALRYQVDLNASFFSVKSLNDKHLLFADPMNATGGSLITILRYLEERKIRPRSIRLFTVISALRGVLNVLRNIDNIHIYTLWMDPMLNKKSYIMPGLGDAGDRINGIDSEDSPRNIIQLISDYGLRVNNLYRAQVRAIEKSVFGNS